VACGGGVAGFRFLLFQLFGRHFHTPLSCYPSHIILVLNFGHFIMAAPPHASASPPSRSFAATAKAIAAATTAAMRNSSSYDGCNAQARELALQVRQPNPLILM